ncbi:b-box zinc finger family protein [Stylonychia lemnae]|uniref:B-box zinc finger family protein n=1 Tax=Stylonychia lemnae TaxID=5949 RepID=A0A078A1H1_STYLE|nr:b-box zinc finger family protein [Stylonychia lemnae]|eukprot:CDW75950.1 b-box zinc finger family protein [Stylonychia lemnae]
MTDGNTPSNKGGQSTKSKSKSKYTSKFEQKNKIQQSMTRSFRQKLGLYTAHLDPKNATKFENLPIGNCPYCLKQRVFMVDFDCGHSYCSKCALNLVKITKIKKGFKDIREYDEERIKKMEKYQESLKSNYIGPPCHLCPNNLEKPPLPAQFECLNCESTLLCYDCKIKHQRNSRYKDHKIVRYEEQAEKEKETLKQEIQVEIEKVETAIQYFSGIEEIFVNQKQLYLKKLSADFEVIYKLVERKHAELRDKISTTYDQNLKEAYQYVEGLEALKDTIIQLEKMDIKVDIDQVNLNKAIMYRLREIETELDFEVQSQDMDLIESRFIQEPFQKIERSLINFDFFPIQNSQLNNLQKIFTLGNSKILTLDAFTTELLFVMPQKMKKAELIYQHSTELTAIQIEANQLKAQQQQQQQQKQAETPKHGSHTPKPGQSTPSPVPDINQNDLLLPVTGAQRFHQKCDNRGPTLVIVKANEGHIFGGFNPTSWVSEFMYSECDDAYLFSITDGQGRKPIKCPIKQEKKDKAIKQNEKSYSPAFGEANISDLFIAFKNLSNSYSMLGNVYKLPKGYKSETFLAGKHNDWKIDEIEIWAVSY